MMQPKGTSSMSTRAMKGDDNHPEGMDFCVVCPSDCLSHWDKQKTPVANSCSTTTCDRRQSNQRRGQDSPKMPTSIHLCAINGSSLKCVTKEILSTSNHTDGRDTTRQFFIVSHLVCTKCVPSMHQFSMPLRNNLT